MRLKIATFNFWGLPWPFSVRRVARLRMLADLVSRERFDIVACQEVWLRQDIRRLRRWLPEYQLCDQCPCLFNRSGLIFLSRLPLSCGLFLPYDMPVISWEFPSKKGILRAQIVINGQPFQIINTHVLYTPNATQTRLQKRQLDQLIDVLDNRPTFLFGDFNREFDAMHLPEHFSLISENTKPSISMTNRFAKMRLNKIGMSDRLPDYIFVNFPVRSARSYFINRPIISDHYPVVAEVDI
ncbi:MAG: endonuclease/exonuclease/phosphatase family protein [Patescibacteria group bacterium]